MPEFAPLFLSIAVGLSAVGAVALCALVVLYGFTPPGEDPPRRAAHRALLTRVGHALAAACFTATAILISVVLVRSTTGATGTASDARVPNLSARVAGQETRLAETELRLHELEEALRRRAAQGWPQYVA